jgi:flagellar assembly protein FliH
MPSFKRYEVVVVDEPATVSEPSILKIDGDFETVIDDFGAPALKKVGERDYAATKARAGALAASDPDRHSPSQKDQRFYINPLLRDPLAIEEEERRFLEERVRAEVESLREAAVQEGYAEGLAAGRLEGERRAFEEARRLAEEAQSRFDRFVSTVEGTKAGVMAAQEQFLVEMVLAVARHVVLRELSTDRDYIVRLLRELVDRIGARDNLTIRVGAGDFAAAAELRSGLEAQLGSLKNLRIEPSPRVVDGGCIVETDWSVVDAAVETQIAQFREQLVKTIDSLPSPSAAGGDSSGGST